MARPTALETAEVRLGQRIKHENVCKMDTLSTVGIGTHKQARMNDHRATQKWVEYYQSRIIFLKAGGYAALNSSDRREIRVAACMLADAEDTPGSTPPTRAAEAFAEYTEAVDRKALLREWAKADWEALGCLWLSGCKGSDVAAAILGIFA